MKRLFIAAIAAASLLLAACAGQQTAGTVDPAQTLYKVKQTYSVAQSAAALYASLPLCGTPAATTKLCADPKTVIQIDEADTAATKAIAAAEKAVKSGAPDMLVLLNAASAAASSLQSKTPAVKP